MRDPRHPRHFTDEFKRQIVDLYNAGKPEREIMDEYDLGKSTVGEVDQVDKRDRLAARRGQPHARAEPDPGARAREPQAPDGGRRLKTSGASIRSEVRAMAANGGAAAPYRRSAGIEAF